jgi:predicted RNA-binding Zn-ribbon protein involved in translation (DUF1610 family)
MTYQVCNRPLRSDGTLYCEFDGDVTIYTALDRHVGRNYSHWLCPACGVQRFYRDEAMAS